MTDVTGRNRVQGGVPTGGQFATEARGENADLDGSGAQQAFEQLRERLAGVGPINGYDLNEALRACDGDVDRAVMWASRQAIVNSSGTQINEGFAAMKAAQRKITENSLLASANIALQLRPDATEAVLYDDGSGTACWSWEWPDPEDDGRLDDALSDTSPNLLLDNPDSVVKFCVGYDIQSNTASGMVYDPRNGRVRSARIDLTRY